MTIYTIYKATNTINNKSYIGFDSNWPARRRAHKRAKTKSHFHNAIRKYGFDKFVWEILYNSLDGQYCLNVMENCFIVEYDTFNSGYNMTIGGGGALGLIHSIEFRHKQSINRKGKKQSHEHKLNNSKAHMGKIHSTEHKINQSIAHKK